MSYLGHRGLEPHHPTQFILHLCFVMTLPKPIQQFPTTLNNFQQPSRPEGAAVEEQPGTSAIQNPTTLTNRQRQTPSHFLEAYEAHAERRTAVLESLVRPDFERWQRLKERRRRSFERKLLTSMGTVVEELKKISNQQEEIIHLLQNKPQ